MLSVGTRRADSLLAGPENSSAKPLTLGAAWRIAHVRSILYVGLVVTCIVAAAGAAAMLSLRDQALTESERELQNVASVFREHFERTFEGLRLTQLAVGQQVQALGIDSVDEFERRMAGPEVQYVLKDRIANLLPVHALLLVSARGRVVNYSRDWPDEVRSVASEEYFTALASSAGPATHVSAPAINPADGEWSFYVAQRLIARNGEFLGLVVAVMRLSYFERMFATVDLGHGSSVGLMRTDGRLLVRYPRVDMSTAPSYAANPMFTSVLPRNGRGSLRVKGMMDSSERVVAAQLLADVPLVIGVGMDQDPILADWRHATVDTIAIAGLLLVVIALVVALCAWEVGKALIRHRTQLDAALNHMSHGLCMFDANGTLVLHNARCLEIFGIPPGLIAPGCSFKELLRRLEQAGITPDDNEAYAAEQFAALRAGRTMRRLRTLRDGRTISIKNDPLPGGGWVSTHEDVTEVKQREGELERANMRFDAALNNMSQGLCMLDAQRRILVANIRFGEIYGLDPEQIAAGRGAPEMLNDEGAADPADALTLANGRTVAIVRHRLPDGSVLTTHEDITERRQNEAKIAYMAHHDLLTGLPNRTLFLEKIAGAGGRLRRRNESFAVLMLDLDRFKEVNDSLGHPAGDALLKEMAQRLRSTLRETDVLARLGGDEFAILQCGEPNLREAAIVLAVRIIQVVSHPFELDGNRVCVGTSIGIAIAPQDGTDADELLKKADLALYRTKAEGRNGYNFFNEQMTAQADERHRLEREMREALARQEFELYYQPMVDTMTREPCGAEALVRWQHPDRGLIAPDRFISLAEDTGLILDLGAWILHKACSDAAAWPVNTKVAVNLSPVQFRRGDLFDLVLCALVDAGLPPERLEIEITESVLLENEASYRVVLQQLRNLGISIVLDDFGTGFSSLGYIAKFPVDKIKIDKSFTQGLLERVDCAAIVASVLTLARGLDIATTAEGVETEEQFEMLQAAGVNRAQGYLFGRPCPASQLAFADEAENRRGSDAA